MTTKTERKMHLASWRSGGQTKKAYCETVGLKYGTFISWFKEKTEEDFTRGHFVKVEKTIVRETEITLPNGVRLYINEPLSRGLLKALSDV